MQACRVSLTRMRGTPALAQRVSKLRLKFRGSMGVPHLVVNTRSLGCHRSPARSRAAHCSARRSLSAVTEISGSGRMSSLSDCLALPRSLWINSLPTR